MAIRTFRGRRSVAGDSQPVCRRLFCFPYAGAGGAVFRQWPDYLPASMEVCVPCLPGCDARTNEPPASKMGPLVESLAREMLASTEAPYALFGHSVRAFI